MAEISDRDQRDLELLKVLAPDGRPTPEQVVKVAKAKAHPWHGEVWGKSDSEAAMAHRIEIARGIISRVRFRIIRDERVMFRPAFVRDPDVGAKKAGYLASDTLNEQPAIASAVLDAELERINGCIARARGLAEQFGMGAEFEALLQQVIVLKRRLKLAA